MIANTTWEISFLHELDVKGYVFKDWGYSEVLPTNNKKCQISCYRRGLSLDILLDTFFIP